MESILALKNLSKRYANHVALKGLNFAVKKGEIFGIIGRSGAGKTTLMRCLTRLETPSDGEMTVTGELGMIFQHFNLFSSRNALRNIAYPLEIAGVGKEKREKRARELLDLVGLSDKASHYPAQLSGGEKQRVAIARALATSPDLLLCDEATSALDPHTTTEILELLSKLNRTLGLTIVLITHEMEVIKHICTHVAVLEQGEIVEQGVVGELFAHPQHSTTKRFLLNMVHELPKREGAQLFRLAFRGEGAKQPIISRLIKEQPVEVNILLGGIDVLRNETVGNLVVELSGAPEALARARQFLEGEGVRCDELE